MKKVLLSVVSLAVLTGGILFFQNCAKSIPNLETSSKTLSSASEEAYMGMVISANPAQVFVGGSSQIRSLVVLSLTLTHSTPFQVQLIQRE